MFQAEVKFSFSFSCPVFVIIHLLLLCYLQQFCFFLFFFKFYISKFGGIGQLPCYCLFFETKVAYFGKSAQYLK